MPYKLGQASEMQEIDSFSAPLAVLTAKQREVLDLVLKHKSSKEIARTLGISHYTVDQRITAARQKLGVKSRGELARSYSRMRELCEETAYEFSHVETPEFPLQMPERDQLVDPVFMLSDATSLQMRVPWHDEPVPPVGLEAFDNRFGIFGRVFVIPALAAFIALLMLSMLTIAETLTNIL